MIDYKAQVAASIAAQLTEIDYETILSMLEYPPNPEMGDLSLPCFKLSKQLRKSPQIIAEQINGFTTPASCEKSEAVTGYVNYYLNKTEFAGKLIHHILTSSNHYGSQNLGEGRTIVIDYSSPNIAKPFHVGHLRSTVIGNAIYKIYEFMGYQCVGVNHIGDWGTQFGKLIVAYHLWGNAEAVESEGIDELLRIYVKFHEEAQTQPELEDQARAWFVKLEQGDEEAVKLWTWFKEISLQEFSRIYDLLGVSFDSYAGESFYNDKTMGVVKELKDKQLLEEDDGALLVRLEEYHMPPALMIKKDGGTLYHTRDVAAAIYRKNTYDFDKCIYVVGGTQSLHFQQCFQILKLMGYDWSEQMIHVPFGQVSYEGEKLSTRKGNVIMLEDMLQKAISKTLEIINSKNPELEDKEKVARQIGVGAIIFNDLSGNRTKDISFSWKEVLNFDGETGPYVQYTHARTCSVLRKASVTKGYQAEGYLAGDRTVAADHLANLEAQLVLKQLLLFPEKVELAMTKLEPSVISRYLVDLAQSFNRFYHECPILVDEDAVREARLALVKCVQLTMQTGMRLIGLEAPEKI